MQQILYNYIILYVEISAAFIVALFGFRLTPMVTEGTLQTGIEHTSAIWIEDKIIIQITSLRKYIHLGDTSFPIATI